MITRILTLLLALTAFTPEVLAHAGHIVDHGHGHDHWFIYVLAACAIQAVIVLFVFRKTLMAKATRRS